MERGQAAASSGEIVWMAPGTYGARGHTTNLSKPDVTYSGLVGFHRPHLYGKFELSGSGVGLRRVQVDGPTGDVGGNAGCDEHPGESVLIDMGAGNTTVALSEVKNSYGNAGIYVSAGGSASGIQIHHNFIHDNGGFGVCGLANENGQHGIYWNSGSGSITNNKIVHNWTRGVQLYEEPHDVVVANNTIVWNGRAGIIHDTSTGGGNIIADNIVAGNAWNGQGGIYYRSGGLPIVVNNLLWQNGEANLIDVACFGCVTISPAFVGISVDSPPAPLSVSRRWSEEETREEDININDAASALG